MIRRRGRYLRWAVSAWLFGGLVTGLVYVLMTSGGGPVGDPIDPRTWPVSFVAFSVLASGAGVFYRWYRARSHVVIEERWVTRSGRRYSRFVDPLLTGGLLLLSIPIGVVSLPYHSMMALLTPVRLAIRATRPHPGPRS